MARLPVVGGDDNTWGDLLNTFLQVEHNADGTQKALDPSKISGTAVVNSDSRLSDSRGPSGSAGGDLSGTYPNPTLKNKLFFNVKEYGAVGNGTTDDSAAFNSAVSAASTAGGGIVWVPRAIYRIADIYLSSNVSVLVDPATTFKIPTGYSGSTGPAIFRLHTVDTTSTSYLTNISIIGLGGSFNIDLTDVSDGAYAGNPRGINVLNCDGFHIENVTGISMTGPAGNVIAISNNQANKAAKNGTIKNIKNTSVRGVGASCVQLSGGSDLVFENLWADGGVPMRAEADNNPSAIIENIHARVIHVTNDSGHANVAAYVSCHANTIRNITYEQLIAEGGAHLLYIGYTGSPPERLAFRGGRVVGGGMILQFGGNNFQPIEATFEDLEGIGSSTYGTYYAGGTWINCRVQGAAQAGYHPEPQGGVPSDLQATFVGCKAIDNSVYGWDCDQHSLVEFFGCQGRDSNAPPGLGGAELLSTNQQGVETNTTGFSVATACTIARSTAQFHSGSASLAITATGTAEADARTSGIGTSGFVVSPSTSYYAAGWFRADAANVTLRNCGVAIRWFDSSGTIIGSDVPANNIQSSSSVWKQSILQTVSPSNAAYATLLFETRAGSTGDITYWDDLQFGTATGGTIVQNYGINAPTGVTVNIFGGDFARNGISVSTGSGTVKSATLA